MGPHAFEIVALLLFVVGASGFLMRRNVLTLIMSLVLLYSGAALAFATYSWRDGNHEGHLAALVVMVLAAAEAALGLAVMVASYRSKKRTNIDEMNELQG